VARSRPFVALLALTLIACDLAAPSQVAPTLVPCGAPTALSVISGFGPAAKAGPLAMRDFPDGATDATIKNWTPGTLEKVLLIQVESASSFTVRGTRCADGHPLRFWYRTAGAAPVGSNATPIPNAVFETMGDDAVIFDGGPASPPDRMFFKMGYMLFASDGDWRIEVRSGETLLGAAILLVQKAR
jgi:hypothetical protein